MDTTAIQRALLSLGYELGKGGPSGRGDDGIWGDRTSAALLAFQRANNLLGDLGERTIAVMKDALAAPSAGVMTVSDDGLIELVSHEALVTAPYLDSVKVWTIGVGHPSKFPMKPLEGTRGLDPVSSSGRFHLGRNGIPPKKR